jgi:hypothetical protein
MAKNRKISSLEFDYLMQMKPYIPYEDDNGRKSMKYTLLDTVERAFGDKWFNLSDKTRQAIDYICFLSVEHGYFYASPEHIATKAGIGKSTVYEALKLMRESGVLFKANRTSRKQNGLGCPVHFFINHPYFPHYNSYLGLGWKPEQKPDWKAENAENACGSKVEDSENLSTLPLPSLHQENDMDIQSNVSAKTQTPIVKYVPKEINELYARTFGFRLRNIWVKITQAFKSIKQSILNRNDLISIGAKIIKRIFQLWKERMRENRDMTVDEMCAFAYKTARETFYNALAEIHMQDMPKEERTFAKAHQNRTVAKNETAKIKVPVPDWMEKINREQDLCKQQKEEAKADLPRLESMYLSMHPDADIGVVKEAVIQSIREKYTHLDRHAISEIEQNYGSITTMKEAYQEWSKRQIEDMIRSLREGDEKQTVQPALLPY